MMRNIKLILEYDGAGFFGFQRQKEKRTVQSELEKAFRRLFRRRVKISAASGRTDSGVHAKHQVVNVKVDSAIPLFKIQQALNSFLPEDLAVADIEEMPKGFHARFSAKRKTYEYTIWNSPARSPAHRRTAYHFPYPLRISLMRQAAKRLVGRHDFRSFEAKSSRKNTIRRIYRCDIMASGRLIRFLIEGDGFLYRMVRNIVGTLLCVGNGRLTEMQFSQLVRRCNRKHIGPTVPAHGLNLISVDY